MAHTQCFDHAPSLTYPPRRLLSEAIALVAEWRRRARSRRELAALCDRCLRDIRVTRYDAYREASKPFWRA
jgi:uncharacterized protein YjiS (DUF1127 family)